MAISFGRGGTGSGASGSSRVGFASAQQESGAAHDIQIVEGTFKGANFATPSWELTLRDSGRASVVFGATVEVDHSSSSATGNVKFEAKLQVAVANSRNTGAIPVDSDWADVTAIGSDGIIFQETQRYASQEIVTHSINVEYPFDLSDLPAAAVDNKYLQFRFALNVVTSSNHDSIKANRGYIALKAFGVGAGSTDVGPYELGLSEGAGEANKFVKYDADGTGFSSEASIASSDLATGAVGPNQLATNAVTQAKIASNAVGSGEIRAGAVGSSEIATGAVGSDELADGAVTHSKIGSDAVEPDNMKGVSNNASSAGHLLAFNSDGTGFASVDHGALTPVIGEGTIGTNQLANDAVTPDKVAGITTGATEAGKSVVLNADGDGFTTSHITGGGGGGITSVEPSDLEGVTGGSDDASKFVRTDGAGTGFAVIGDLTPSELGITEGTNEGGKLVALNSTGDGFTSVTAQSGGATVTLDNITGGPLGTTKGGTGLNASGYDDLRTKLGILTAATDAPMVYCNNADTQKNNTIHRVDASTTSVPTEVVNSNTVSAIQDGVVIRSGNDQLAINLSDGRQWVRTLTDSNNGSWSTPSSAEDSLTTLTSEPDLRGMAEGVPAILSSSANNAFRPSYTDGTHPTKVIIARANVGGTDYLIATNRSNFWWALRPTDSTWSQISWQWEGTSHVPQGLLYSGGETDEEHIPVGDVAVLGYKSGIDGEASIHVMVVHTISGSTSTYTGYFVNDDGSMTVQSSQNTRGYTKGTWARTQLDHDGISDTVIAWDSTEEEPVFLGIVPGIRSLTFSDYTFKTSGNPSAGDIAWYATQRGVRAVQKAGDPHLGELFQEDFEVEIRKDSSNYIRGVFESVTPVNVPGFGSVVQAVFRAADLAVVGTISAEDTVDIIGHKAVYTKRDVIDPIGLGITEGSGEANKFVRLNSTGTQFVSGSATIANADIADDAVTPAKLGGVSTGADEAGKAIVLDSTGNAFSTSTLSSGSIGDGSITRAKLAADAVDNSKLADDAVQSENIADDAITNALIADDAVDTAQIADGAVEAAQLASDAVTGAKIADDAVDTAQIVDDAVEAAQIADGAVGNAALAADAVTGAKLADDAVGNEHIANNAVNTAQVASGAITPAKINNITPNISLAGHALAFDSQGTGFTTAVLSGGGGGSSPNGRVYLAEAGASDTTYTYNSGTSHNETESLYTTPFEMTQRSTAGGVFYFNGLIKHNGTHAQTWSAKLQARWASSSAGVTSATNWADCTIFNTSSQFFNETITAANRNIFQDYSIALPFNFSDLPSGVADNQWVQFRVVYTFSSNTTPVPWTLGARRYYGISLTGASAIADGSLTGAKLADDAVTNAKIADDAVGAENIADGAVGNAALAADAVTGAEIADDAVDTAQIADDAVEGAQIADNAVGQAAIADDAVGADQLASAAVVPGSISGLTAGSGIASKVLAFDSTGTAFTAVDQSSGGGSGGGQFLAYKPAFTITDLTDNTVVWSDEITPAFQVSDQSEDEIFVAYGLNLQMHVQGTQTSIVFQIFMSYRNASTEAGLSSATWNSLAASDAAGFGYITKNDTTFITEAIDNTRVIATSLLTNVSDGDYVQMRMGVRQNSTPGGNAHAGYANRAYLLVDTLTGGSGGGSSTPADNSITTAMLQNDAVTSAKIADDAITQNLIADNAVTNDAILDGTIDLDKLATLYRSTGNYTFQADESGGIDDGKFGYTQSRISGVLTGQIAFNMLSADSGAIAQFVQNRWVVLWKNALNYVIGKQSNTTSTLADDSTEGAFRITNLYRVGSFANNDTVRLFYGGSQSPNSVLQINAMGNTSAGPLAPYSLGIDEVHDGKSNHIITIDNAGTGFDVIPPANAGIVKAQLMLRSNTGGSGDGQTVASADSNSTYHTWTQAQNMQTGGWVMDNKSTDWMRVSAAGLYFFGFITAQPIVADLELWVRWKGDGESYQNWSTTNGSTILVTQSRVAAVAMGGDKLQITKLFSGGINQATNPDQIGTTTAPVDCAVPSGNKFLKLSQLPSGIADGDEVQFTVGFRNQGSGPAFTVRNFFLTCDILDGGNIHANY